MNVIESRTVVTVLRWLAGHAPLRGSVPWAPVTTPEARQAAEWLADRTGATLRDTGHHTITPAEITTGWPLDPLEDAPDPDADPDAEAIAHVVDGILDELQEIADIALTTSDPGGYLLTALAEWLENNGRDEVAERLDTATHPDGPDHDH